MDDKERVLNLTFFNRRTFGARVHLRHIFDWAHDYWERGERLAKIILSSDDYKDLLHQIEDENIFVKRDRMTELNSIDAGFGPIIIQVEKKLNQPEL